MPNQMTSGSIWDWFWLPKCLPNRGPEGVQTRFLMHISDRSRKGRFLQALFLHYQHCEDAIWLWIHRCFERFCFRHFSPWGPRGVLDAFKNVFFSGWPPRTPPEWILDAIWTPWDLDFEEFLETILAWNFNPTCICHFCFPLHFVELPMHWSSKYWYPFETSFLQSWASLTKG